MRFVFLMLSLLSFGALAAADTDSEALAAAHARVGNTVIATDPDGTSTHIYWRADGTFSAWRPGWKSEGTWFVKDGKLCLTYEVARPNMGTSECMTGAKPHKVGDVWKTEDRTVTLAPGRQ